MANSRIMLTCKHCGDQFVLGKGYFGSYFTVNEKMYEQLNEFYAKHNTGECSDDIDASDDAKNHFVILEEGDSLMEVAVTDYIQESYDDSYNEAKAEVAREIFKEIERLLSANQNGEFRGDSIEWFDYFDLHLAEDIAELKKKYTKGGAGR